MPRTAIATQSPVGPFVTLPAGAGSLDLTFTAADVANGNQFAATGRDAIVIWNSDGAAAHNFSLSSVAEPRTKRTGDITNYSLAATKISMFLVSQLPGWQQSDGNIYLNGDHANLKFAIVTLPQL